VVCFRRPFVRGHAKFAAGPFTEIDQLTAFAAKRAVRIAGKFGFFLAGRTLHRVKPERSSNDSSNEIVLQAIRNLGVIERAGLDLRVASIID
jgi:hypothetical protein